MTPSARRGCGGVTIGAVPLEDLVLASVFHRLDTPDLGRLLGGNNESADRLKKLLDDRATQELRVKDVLKDYSRGDLTRNEMLFSKAKAKLDEINEKLNQVSRGYQATALLPVGATVRETWFATDSLQWKQQILSLLIDEIVIQPGGGKPFYDCEVLEGRFRFDPNRVAIRWKA